MRCEECEYRFRCFTLAINERPKRVKINWKINNTCGNCQNAEFGVKVISGTTTTKKVGYCPVAKMIVHKESAMCNEETYKPKRIVRIDKIYSELKDESSLKNKKTKLPKYCVEE